LLTSGLPVVQLEQQFGLQSGAALLTKPYTRDSLLAAINNRLGKAK